MQKFKPNKRAYLFAKTLSAFFVAVILYLAMVILLSFVLPGTSAAFYLAIIIIIGLLLDVLYYLICYKKEEYIFNDNKLIHKGGSIFSDFEIELVLKNITHVKTLLPFLENKFFQTGHIAIESAGSGKTEIRLQSIDNPRDIEERLIGMMKVAGFSLDKNQLMMTERPNSLAVFFEVLKKFFLSLLVVFYIYQDIQYDDDGNKVEYIAENLDKVIFLTGLVALLVFIYQIFNYLDLSKRVYQIYGSVLCYNEGFLSKNFAFVPFENLTDSEITQSFVDKVFGLYDVKISCQGTKHEILFSNIKNGKKMSDKIDELIRSSQKVVNVNGVLGQSASNVMQNDHAADKELCYDKEFSLETGKNFKKTVGLPLYSLAGSLAVLVFVIAIGFLFDGDSLFSIIVMVALTTLGFTALIALPISLIVSIVGYIQYKATTFSVGKTNFLYKYHFLSSKETELNPEKITGLLIERSFIDDWFGTQTMKFWSVGTVSTFTFKDMTTSTLPTQNVLSKIGIGTDEPIYTIRPNFSLAEYLKSSIILFTFVGLLGLFIFLTLISVNFLFGLFFVVLVFILVSLVYLYKVEVWKRSGAVFYRHYVCFKKGWLYKKEYYAKYKDIKDAITTKYPFSNEGKIQFNVAGENIIEQGRQSKVVHNSFLIEFVNNILVMDEIIDYILFKRPSKTEVADLEKNVATFDLAKVNESFKPSLKNAIIPGLLLVLLIDTFVLFIVSISDYGASGFMLVLGFLILVSGLVLLPVYLSTIMTEYRIDGYRVIERSGIVYKKQLSIIFSNIDFISNNQGFFNKIFSNGNIMINTIGSSQTEMTLRNITEYVRLYEKLKVTYNK